MARSVGKAHLLMKHLIKKVQDHLKENKLSLSIPGLEDLLLPQFVGITFNVYNGHLFLY